MNDIMKVTKSLKDAALLIKGVTETVENEIKEQKERFFAMVVTTLASSLLESILSGKGVIRADKRTIRTGQGY